MTSTKIIIVATLSLLMSPAFAQTSATPTGKSDTTSSGMMKPGDTKAGSMMKMKKKHHSMKKSM